MKTLVVCGLNRFKARSSMLEEFLRSFYITTTGKCTFESLCAFAVTKISGTVIRSYLQPREI